MIIDPAKVASLIAEIADEEIAARFGNLAAGDIDTKTGPQDFVTEADRGAEARLARALTDLYPGSAFVGEELAADEPDVLSALDRDGAVWVVDPLDGTKNFIEGVKRFGSIIALIENGETRAGWIYAIPDQAFAVGSKGDGVTWRGERLPQPPTMNQALQGFRAIGNMNEPWKSTFVPRLRASLATETMRCSAYGYIDLVRGMRDFALYSRCHPWDHAAGILMLDEVAGCARYLDDGAPYKPLPTQGRPLLVAADQPRWNQVEKLLTG